MQNTVTFTWLEQELISVECGAYKLSWLEIAYILTAQVSDHKCTIANPLMYCNHMHMTAAARHVRYN